MAYEELKPCPFCGAVTRIQEERDEQGCGKCSVPDELCRSMGILSGCYNTQYAWSEYQRLHQEDKEQS